jgi:two-component system response regulator YesN
MYRLLIVDDEPHIVDWLTGLFKGLDSQDLEVYKANTGMAALELLDSIRIDVILLDVRMPGLSGLEVADRINCNWPACRIVFLTGHSDFDSMYKANKLKNVSYLLKTEDDSEIIHAVQDAISSIQEKERILAEARQALWGRRLAQHVFMREILKGIIAGRTFEEIKRNTNWDSNEFAFQPDRQVFLIYGKLDPGAHSWKSSDMAGICVKMETLVENALHQRFVAAVVDSDSTSILCFLQSRQEACSRNVSDIVYLKECLDAVILQSTKELDCRIVLFLLENPVDWGDCSVAYEQMLHKTNQLMQCESMHHSYASILKTDSVQHSLSENIGSSSGASVLLENLAHYLIQGDRVNFFTTLKIISGPPMKKCNMHHLPTIKCYQSVAWILMDCINRCQLQDQVGTQIRLHTLYSLEHFGSWKDAFDYLTRLAEKLFDLLKIEDQSHEERLVGEIKHYIRHHLDSDLTLTTISNLVNYSSTYVSRVFNQTAHKSLTTYINHVRIEKAKELLQKTNEPIQSIALKVGFDTSQYFSLVFKKTVGVSPRDFRNPLPTEGSG